MNTYRRNALRHFLGLSALVLAGCGGGGDSDPATTNNASSDGTSGGSSGITIGTQPQGITVRSGQTATFSVAASTSNNGNLSYQWMRNGAVISWATAATYTTDVLTFADNGAIFTAAVAEGGNAVVSEAATLVVSPKLIQVSSGVAHSAALSENGWVWTWGLSTCLGAGGTAVAPGTIVQVLSAAGAPFENVAAISVGYIHTVALKRDGTVWTWGSNDFGELGDGTRSTRLFPVQVKDNSGRPLADVIAVSGGGNFSLALKADGTLLAWGRASGLGTNDTTNGQTVAHEYVTTPQVVLRNDGSALSGVTQVDSGYSHVIARRSDGTAWVWGANGSGVLGNGTSVGFAFTAQQVETSAGGGALSNVASASAGFDHTVALLSDGSVAAWGTNIVGQLGDGTTIERGRAVLMKDGSGAVFSGVTQALAGQYGTALLRSDGTVWMTGQNMKGQLGNGSPITLPATTPVQVQHSDGTPLRGIIQIAMYEKSILALTSDGTVWAWGDNYYGEIGLADASYSTRPVEV